MPVPKFEIMSPDTMKRIETTAMEMATNFVDELMDSMLDRDGSAYGDVELSREQRMLKFIDEEERGVNTQLKIADSEEYNKRVKQFRTDAETFGLV